jgi:hypothetical protein
MAKQRKPVFKDPSWASRKERFVSVQVPRDLGRMLKVVADEENLSMGQLLDAITREIVEGKFRLVLERQVERMGGKARPERKTG